MISKKLWLALLVFIPFATESAQQPLPAPKNHFIHQQIDSSYERIFQGLDSAIDKLDTICQLLDSKKEQRLVKHARKHS